MSLGQTGAFPIILNLRVTWSPGLKAVWGLKTVFEKMMTKKSYWKVDDQKYSTEKDIVSTRFSPTKFPEFDRGEQKVPAPIKSTSVLKETQLNHVTENIG